MKVFEPKVENGNPNNKKIRNPITAKNVYSVKQIEHIKAQLNGTCQVYLKK